MKKISIILAIIMLLGLLSSCEGIGDGSIEKDLTKSESFENEVKNKTFEFSYEIERTEYLRGAEIRITATVKNISGKVQKYMGCSGNDYIPMAELYCLNGEGEYCGRIDFEPIMFPCDIREKKIEKGAVGSHTYVFNIPDDAVCGEYSLKLWRGEDSRVFENILKITDVTAQNVNDKYNYSPISVSAGGASVNPIRGGTSTYVQNADGTSMIGCDGLGVWLYLGNDKTDLSTFPLLMLEGKLKVEFPEHTKLEGIIIYDLKGNRIGGFSSVIRDVEALSAGEYVIVLKTVYDTSGVSQTEYETTHYDDFFRLSVPDKRSRDRIDKYGYSPVSVISGDVEINPLRTYLYSSYHKDGEGYEGDGLGVLALFEDNEFSYLDLPYIILTGEGGINWSHPANVTVGYVKIYRLDYSEMHFDAEFLSDISKLPEGEYIVVFHEKEDFDEYTTYGYESVFRLIVHEQAVKSFSFATVKEIYKPGDPGVKTSGFKNKSESSVANSTEAVERAKNECTIGYDTVTVLHDGWDDVWSVTFSTCGTLGGCQTVYLDSKGITLLIVYGE